MQKKKEQKTLAISNVLGSTITREADNVIYTLAGPEIQLLQQKSYSSTSFRLSYLLSLYMGAKTWKNRRKRLSKIYL